MPNQPFLFADGIEKGSVSIPGFGSKYFGGPNDSIAIIFDNLYRVAHYANTPTQLASKFYLNISLRNIGNPLSYRFVSTEIGSGRRNEHFYDFTEEDYLYAL